jgi:hypothetical protein
MPKMGKRVSVCHSRAIFGGDSTFRRAAKLFGGKEGVTKCRTRLLSSTTTETF